MRTLQAVTELIIAYLQLWLCQVSLLYILQCSSNPNKLKAFCLFSICPHCSHNEITNHEIKSASKVPEQRVLAI